MLMIYDPWAAKARFTESNTLHIGRRRSEWVTSIIKLGTYISIETFMRVAISNEGGTLYEGLLTRTLTKRRSLLPWMV
jgi:hypothetical protein